MPGFSSNSLIDPSHRYQSADELAADLQRYLGDEPIRAKWVSPVTRFSRWCKRNPAIAGLTTTIAILLLAAAAISSAAAAWYQCVAETNAQLVVQAETDRTKAQEAEQAARIAQGEAEEALPARRNFAKRPSGNGTGPTPISIGPVAP